MGVMIFLRRTKYPKSESQDERSSEEITTGARYSTHIVGVTRVTKSI